MEIGELCTRWTVRLAMALYAGSLALRAGSNGKRSMLIWSRLAWTAGCLAYLIHVACAFQFYHHWSHAEAYAATAQTTHKVVGLDWGGGLYANYAFTLVWLADVAWWWWRGLEKYESRSRFVEWPVQGFLGFIAFNATVVFATGFSRWLGIAACMLFAAIWLGRPTRVYNSAIGEP